MSAANTIGLAVFAIGAGLAFNYAYATYIVPDVEMQATLNALLKAIPETLPNKVLLFVAIAIIAPVLEEVLFRGLLQNSLANRMAYRDYRLERFLSLNGLSSASALVPGQKVKLVVYGSRRT